MLCYIFGFKELHLTWELFFLNLWHFESEQVFILFIIWTMIKIKYSYLKIYLFYCLSDFHCENFKFLQVDNFTSIWSIVNLLYSTQKNIYRSKFFRIQYIKLFYPDCMFFFLKVGSIFLGDQLKLHLLLDSYKITWDSEIAVPMIRSSCHVWPCCTYHCLPGMTLKQSGSLVLPVHRISYKDKINMSGPMFSRSLLLQAAFRAEKSFRNLKSAL